MVNSPQQLVELINCDYLLGYFARWRQTTWESVFFIRCKIWLICDFSWVSGWLTAFFQIAMLACLWDSAAIMVGTPAISAIWLYSVLLYQSHQKKHTVTVWTQPFVPIFNLSITSPLLWLKMYIVPWLLSMTLTLHSSAKQTCHTHIVLLIRTGYVHIQAPDWRWNRATPCMCYEMVLLHLFHFHVFKLLKSYYRFLSILSLVLLDLILSRGLILFLNDIFHLIGIWSCGHYYKVQGWTHGKHMSDTCLPHIVHMYYGALLCNAVCTAFSIVLLISFH